VTDIPETAGAMSQGRAEQINGRLVNAFVARVNGEPPPSFTDITLSECLEATRIMQGHRIVNADRSSTFACTVEPTRIPRLYAWTIVQQAACNAG